MKFKINNIEIRVWKPGTGDNGIPLTAEKGKAACKILVDTAFKWPDEKESLKAVYPKFTNYVADPTVKWYP